jgi:predicted ATPase
MPRDLTDRTPVVALQTFALLANVRPRKPTTPILQYYVALMGQWYNSGVTDTISATMRIAQRVHSLAKKEGDPALMMGAYRALADPLYFSGDFENARDYAIRATQIWRSGVQSPVEEVDVPVVTCLTTTALCEWHLGEIAGSKWTIAEAISLARELGNTQALALAILTAAILTRLENQRSQVEGSALELVELSARRNLATWIPLGSIHLGWARAVSGDVPRGLSRIEEAIHDYRERGSVLALPYFLALKAEILHLASRASEALTAINEAEAISNRSGVRCWSSELQRLRGVFLASMRADENQVKDSFAGAIRIAREQKSISLERRAEAARAAYFRQKTKGSRSN